jgi:ligand-binding sensor domain-containing protein
MLEFLKEGKTCFWLLLAVLNKFIKYSLAAIALFGLTGLCQAQNPIRFQNITVNDGLSMGTITAFEKDYNGFIWIATAEGLHRYDGQNFKIFKHQENIANSLDDSYITCLFSYQNRLYIGNNIGSVDVLNVDNYSFEHINIKRADPKFDNAIEQIILYKGRLVIDTDGGGLWQYDIDLARLRRLDIREVMGEEVNHIVLDDNRLLLATATRIISTDLQQARTVFRDDNLEITCVVKYDSTYVIGTNRGLYSTNLSFGNTKKVPLPPKKRNISGITSLQVQNRELWIGTVGGLLNYTDRSLSLYRTNQLRPFSLVNDNVNTLFLDSDNILWIGTIAGVSTYAPQLQKFGLLQYFELEDESFNNNVYSTYEDKSGTIWLGTLSSGLIKLNKRKEIEAVYPKLVDGSYESSSVRAIYEDSKGNFWVGTGKQGLFLFNRSTGQFKMVACKENGKIKSNTVRHICEDSKGQIWIALQSGIAVKDSLTNNFTEYRGDAEHRNNSIYQIEEDPKTGNLILASFRGGLQLFNPKTKAFKMYVNDATDSTSINNNNLMSLAWVGSDTLLIGTYGGGLNIFNLRTQKFSHVTESNGLVNNAVYGVIYNGNGSCWLSTNNGVVHYNLTTKKFINFKPEHYLQSTEFNEGAFLKSSTGMLYFGGVNGLNYFKPNKIRYDTTAPKIYFTDIRGVFTARDDNVLEISFLSSRLEIDFMSLNFVNPTGINYEYRLLGFDENWISGGAINTAIYPRLSPGAYTFQVRAVDEFGNWEASSQPLRIVVNPPIWQRWWFISFCLLTITGIIVAIFRYRTKQIERLYKLQLVDSELTALRSQMNPHFIFNSLNSIQYFILKKEPREAYTYLSKFASLMRKILQNSRLKYISVADEIEGLNLYLEMERMRMDNNLDYEINTRNIDDPEHTYIPTMLIQPFAENSIVHGLLGKKDNRKLSVLISRENNHLLCTITDNGVGRDASRIINEKRSSKHTSSGMSLTQKRLAILSEGRGDYDVVIEDLHHEDGSKGTLVKLVVPVITQID